MPNQSFVQKNIKALTLLACAVGVLVVSMFIVSERLESYENLSRVQIADQAALLVSIAETTARNGADATTEAIVRDCPVDDRVRFDELLGQLDGGLSQPELRELDQLFGACASFHAERKAAMVARLSREIEVYDSYVEHLSTLTGQNESDEFTVSRWQELAEQEQAQSEQFSKLVSAQKQIIDALMAGNTAASDEMVQILDGVRETQEALLFANTQASIIRSELSDL